MEEFRVEQKVAKTDQPGLQKPRVHDHLNLVNDAAQLTTEDECEKVVISAPSGEFQIAWTLAEPGR